MRTALVQGKGVFVQKMISGTKEGIAKEAKRLKAKARAA